jgi:hypothetical protein
MSYPLRHASRACVVTLLVSLVGACATAPGTSFATSVTALKATSPPPGRSFVILPGTRGVTESDLQFQETERFVEAALRQRGFTKAQPPQSADLALFVSYGIGNPVEETYSYLVPQLGFVPTTTTVNGTVTSSGNTSTLSGTSATGSKLGITGFGTATESYTTYTRYLLVTAVDLAHYKSTGEAREAWKTAVVSIGSSNDFRRVLPALVVASSKYLGEMTDHIIDENIGENDARIVALKQLVRAPATTITEK